MLAEWFANPYVSWAFLAFVPLLIVYLIRPQPKQQTIPSLMFLLQDRFKRRNNAFLRTLLRELFLLLHILLVAGLVAAIGLPYLSIPAEQYVRDTVLVLDDSASMHAIEDGQRRWQHAVKEANARLGRSNTIILAGRIPQVAVEEASAEEARQFLSLWEPSHQPTYLSGAILTAQDYASEKSSVSIISDFADTDPDLDYQDAIRTVQAQGITVDLVQIATPTTASNNLGIVDVTVTETTTEVVAKNYHTAQKSTKICAGGVCEDLKIDGGEAYTWTVSTPPGIFTIELTGDDEFPLDDSIRVSTPTKTEVSVLVVTNGAFTETPFWHALEAIQETTPLTFTVDVVTPPKLAQIDHDIIIFSDIDAKRYVGRTSRDALSAVKEGAAAIIMYQQDIYSLDGIDDLLLFSYLGAGGSTPVRNAGLRKQFTNIDFGSTPEYHVLDAQKAMERIAVDADGHPIIALYRIGAGNVLWYGMPDETATFNADPLYPVFWKHVIDDLVGRQDVNELNRRTGEIISAPQIRLPDGTVSRDKALLTEQGLYEVPDGVIAATLSNDAESSLVVPEVTGPGTGSGYDREERVIRKDVTPWVIALILLLLFIELTFIKWRGDA